MNSFICSTLWKHVGTPSDRANQHKLKIKDQETLSTSHFKYLLRCFFYSESTHKVRGTRAADTPNRLQIHIQLVQYKGPLRCHWHNCKQHLQLACILLCTCSNPSVHPLRSLSILPRESQGHSNRVLFLVLNPGSASSSTRQRASKDHLWSNSSYQHRAYTRPDTGYRPNSLDNSSAPPQAAVRVRESIQGPPQVSILSLIMHQWQ